MKRVVTTLSVILFLCSLSLLAYGETTNPYPPPSDGVVKVMEVKGGAWSSAPTGAEMLADLIFVRPISIAACALGFAGSVLATPLTPLSGRPVVYDRLVNEPLEFTFHRPLGEF